MFAKVDSVFNAILQHQLGWCVRQDSWWKISRHARQTAPSLPLAIFLAESILMRGGEAAT